MISFQSARKVIFKNLSTLKAIDLPISKTAGFVLAEDIFASSDGPEFDKATMDGFAVCSIDTRSKKTVLQIVDNISAGSSPKKNVHPGFVSKIATGAMIPKGADSVVMKENARLIGDKGILVLKSVVPGENIYKRSRDFKKGERLLKKGVVLNMAHAALLSSQGYKLARVYGAPLVSVLSTGSEIIEPGAKKTKSQIWNASAAMLSNRLNRLNFSVRNLGIVPDISEALSSKIKDGLKSGILLITGAVSEGDHDLVPKILRNIGAKILIHKVSVKPGKPFLFAIKNKCLIFGLPGNPVSSMVSFLLFVEPVIKKLLALDAELLFEEGILSKSVYNNSNRVYFYPMKLTKKNGDHIVEPVASSGSADLLAVSKADGFLMLDASQKLAKKNSVVKFLRVF